MDAKTLRELHEFVSAQKQYDAETFVQFVEALAKLSASVPLLLDVYEAATKALANRPGKRDFRPVLNKLKAFEDA